MRKLDFTLKSAVMLSTMIILAGCRASTQPSTDPQPTPTPTAPSVSNPTSPETVSTTTSNPESVPTASADISIKNFAFNPSNTTVKVGTKVTWTNEDSMNHTISSDINAFESGHMAKGQSFSFIFNKAGTYAYYCALHPSMTGTIIVNP